MKNNGLNFLAKNQGADFNRRGVSIFLAMIMLTLILSLALGVNTLLISQIKTMRDSGNSVVAFYSAESGIEWALWQCVIGNITDSSAPPYHNYLDLNDNFIEDAEADATYDVAVVAPGVGQCAATADFCIKSVGMFMGTRRVIQIQL